MSISDHHSTEIDNNINISERVKTFPKQNDIVHKCDPSAVHSVILRAVAEHADRNPQHYLRQNTEQL